MGNSLCNSLANSLACHVKTWREALGWSTCTCFLQLKVKSPLCCKWTLSQGYYGCIVSYFNFLHNCEKHCTLLVQGSTAEYQIKDIREGAVLARIQNLSLFHIISWLFDLQPILKIDKFSKWLTTFLKRKVRNVGKICIACPEHNQGQSAELYCENLQVRLQF